MASEIDDLEDAKDALLQRDYHLQQDIEHRREQRRAVSVELAEVIERIEQVERREADRERVSRALSLEPAREANHG